MLVGATVVDAAGVTRAWDTIVDATATCYRLFVRLSIKASRVVLSPPQYNKTNNRDSGRWV